MAAREWGFKPFKPVVAIFFGVHMFGFSSYSQASGLGCLSISPVIDRQPVQGGFQLGSSPGNESLFLYATTWSRWIFVTIHWASFLLYNTVNIQWMLVVQKHKEKKHWQICVINIYAEGFEPALNLQTRERKCGK